MSYLYISHMVIHFIYKKRRRTKQKKQITVKGINGIKWNSSNSSVVSVSKNGTIYAKKTGNAVLMGTLGDLQLGCAVSVVTPARKRTVPESYLDCKDLYIQPAKAYAGKILRLQFSGVEILS